MIRSLLKWPGGKSRVMPELLPHLPKAGCLVEPFVGGASVFLNTDYRRYILADINPDLIRLYREVKSNPELVIDLARPLFATGNSKEEYLQNRRIFNGTKGLLDVARAALFLYLNRHGYNGVVRYNQSGGYNVPFGQHKTAPYFPEAEIRQFAEKANDTKAIFLCSTFQNTLKVMVGTDETIYCDPPYLPASETANFTQYHTEPFTEKHHRQLAAELLEVNRKYGAPVVISNSDTETTREIYHRFRLHEIDVQRSVSTDANNRQKAKEVIGTLGIVEGCPAGGADTARAAGSAWVLITKKHAEGFLMASLIEFLEAVGLENVTVQPLHQCITSVAMERKGGAKVSFLTNEITPSDAFGEMKRTAFIVWMDAEKFDAALEKTKDK